MATTTLIEFKQAERPAGDVALFQTALYGLKDQEARARVGQLHISRSRSHSPLVVACALLVLAAMCAAAFLLMDAGHTAQKRPAATPAPSPSGRFSVGVSGNGAALTPSRFRMATVELRSRSSAHGKMKEVLRNGPQLMEVAKRSAVAAASACLHRSIHARIDSGHVLGASGGLLFALALVDQLTPGDLTGGRNVTGTGAISPAGRVGPVLEIGRKVRSAERSGAEVFLVPYSQLDEAKHAATRISVAGVRDLSEALTVLTGAGCGPHASRA
jgi:hypothetical protein